VLAAEQHDSLNGLIGFDQLRQHSPMLNIQSVCLDWIAHTIITTPMSCSM
jgi:hypothetical protein